MVDVEEISKRMNKMDIILLEQLKDTDYIKDFQSLNTLNSEELIIKIESLIIKSKFMIKNANPDASYSNINSLYKTIEESLKQTKKHLDIKETKVLLQYLYKTTLFMHVVNEGFCNRIQNKRLDQQLKYIESSIKNLYNQQNKPEKEKKLTEHQIKVLQLYANGYETKKEIAEELNIKECSVRDIEERIKNNLGVNTLMMAVNIAAQKGLIK